MKNYILSIATLFTLHTATQAQTLNMPEYKLFSYATNTKVLLYEMPLLTNDNSPAEKNTTTIASLPAAQSLKLYPAPCINTLMVDNSQEEYLNYRIVSYEGREINSGMLRPQGTSRINVCGFPSGTYLLCVTGLKGGDTYKFVKM